MQSMRGAQVKLGRQCGCWSAHRTHNPAALGLSPVLATCWICSWLSQFQNQWPHKKVCSVRKHLFLFAARDVSRGGTSATQRQKFHTDDTNQCLHNKSGSHGVPNINLSNFMCLLVDFGEELCSCANKHQQNSNALSLERRL